MAARHLRSSRPMSRRRREVASLVFLVLGVLLFPSPSAAMTVSYLYNLSDFSGTVPYDDVKISADERHDEVYAVVGNSVRVFNGSGMEVFRFDVDPSLGTIFDLATDESGDILLLTLALDAPGPGPGWSVARCNYRGEPMDRIPITGLPREFRDFRPNEMLIREGHIILASLSQLQVVVVDRSGAFQKGYDLAKLIGIKDKDRPNSDLFGFSLDRQGNMLFTIPALFKAFVVSPDGTSKAFGRAGSAPGAFSVVAGIVADDHGDLLVADKGRGVVMVFDPNLEFLTEFGSGEGKGVDLVRPTDLTLGRSGKLYVTQARERGVAVFKLDPGRDETETPSEPRPADRPPRPRSEVNSP